MAGMAGFLKWSGMSNIASMGKYLAKDMAGGFGYAFHGLAKRNAGLTRNAFRSPMGRSVMNRVSPYMKGYVSGDYRGMAGILGMGALRKPGFYATAGIAGYGLGRMRSRR